MQKLERSAAQRGDLIALVAIALAGIAVILWIWQRLGSGVDFSDDGYYLNLDRDPALYKYSVTQFGFLYSPLFRLLDWNVALFRRTGMLITVTLSGILVAAILHRAEVRWLQAICLAVALAPVSLILFYLWIPTPGYNSLGFQGLLVVATSLLAIDSPRKRIQFAGWVLLGVGGWLAFMAKPTTAAALGIVVLLYLIGSQAFRLRSVAISVITALALILFAALAIDGSPSAFVMRLQTGASFAAMLEGGHTIAGILRFDGFVLSFSELASLLVNVIVIALATAFVLSTLFWRRLLGLAIASLYALASFAIACGLVIPPFGFGTFFALQIWAAPLGGLIGMFLAQQVISLPAMRYLLLAATFAVIPHTLAFGTNNNYWSNGAMAAMFWVVAGVVIIAFATTERRWQALLPPAAGALCIVAVLMAGATEQAYRQTQPLRLQQTSVSFGPGGHTLLLSSDFAAYIETLRTLAKNSGFVADTPIIDLTGHYPGALFALEARAIGQAWTIGGYSGSNGLARAALELVPCDLIAAAWLLTEPNGERALSLDAIFPFTLPFEDVGRISSPTGTYPKSYSQHLMRPLGTQAAREAICKAERI